jgi:hypothetical protein
MGLQLPSSLGFYSRVDQNRRKHIERETNPRRWGSCNTVPVANYETNIKTREKHDHRSNSPKL